MANTQPPATELELLMDLSRTLVAVAVRSLGAIDGEVPLPQFRALTVLERVGPSNAGSLATAVGLHISSITRMADRLVEAGLMTRQVNPDNRREVELRITDTGSKLVHQVWQARSGELARALRTLSPVQRRSLREAIAPLLAVLDDGTAEPGWG